MGLGLCRYFPRAPCPLSTKGIRSSHRKEKEFSAVPSPVRQSVLHDSDVRCFSPTAFLLFASLGTNPALISPNSQIRNMYFPFSSFYNQHHACKVQNSSVTHRNPGWPKAGNILQNSTAFVGFASAFLEILTRSRIRECHLNIHPTKNCAWKRERIPDTKTHRSWELIPPPLPVVLVVSKRLQKVKSRASPAPGEAGNASWNALKCLSSLFSCHQLFPSKGWFFKTKGSWKLSIWV